MTEAAPRELTTLAKIVVGLGALLIVAGVVWHGVTVKNTMRVWHDLVDRPGSEMSFRFILQPLMAVIAAIHDGLEDGRTGSSPYFWTIMSDPQQRIARLNEGLNATARIILLGIAMDVIYQLMVFKKFYPVEAVIIALLLAFVPYLVMRGLVVRAWSRRAFFNRPESHPE
ncbi:MAG: hypothetical protein JO105_17330 [Hyphomicrobiales bacterium]|nr:hypothetical protein [Hyphomicrobiales bacterium]